MVVNEGQIQMRWNEKSGMICIVASLLLGYSVILGLLGHTFYIGGNWLHKEIILSLIFFVVGWSFIFPSLKANSIKDCIKKPFIIIMLIISILIMYSLGQYLSQVGVPFLNRGMFN